MEYKILIIMIMVVSMITATAGGVTTTAFAKKEMTNAERYQSGYNHGCSDAQIEDPKEWYINGINSKGVPTNKAFHTTSFNSGYDAGFVDCGGQIVSDPYMVVADDIITETNTEINNEQQEQNQAASTNQNGSCGTILIGDCYIGQSSTNTFAANAKN